MKIILSVVFLYKKTVIVLVITTIKPNLGIKNYKLWGVINRKGDNAESS